LCFVKSFEGKITVNKAYAFCLTMALTSVLFLCGCANDVYWVNLNYKTPGNSGITLKKDSKVKLLAVGDVQVAQATLHNIARTFDKSQNSEVKIIFDANEPADYYILLRICTDFRISSPEAVPFNGSTRIVERNSETSGCDMIYTSPGTPSVSGATSVLGSIYSIASLDPVYHFEISMHDGDFAIEEGRLRGNEQFVKLFVEQISYGFSDMFLTKVRGISTAIPQNIADDAMVSALQAGAVNDVAVRAQALIPDNFEEYRAKIMAVEKEKDRKQFEEGLCCYYLLALSRELVNFDIDNLRRLHKLYSQIFLITQDDGLAKACANSLARVEQKAQISGVKL